MVSASLHLQRVFQQTSRWVLNLDVCPSGQSFKTSKQASFNWWALHWALAGSQLNLSESFKFAIALRVSWLSKLGVLRDCLFGVALKSQGAKYGVQTVCSSGDTWSCKFLPGVGSRTRDGGVWQDRVSTSPTHCNTGLFSFTQCV